MKMNETSAVFGALSQERRLKIFRLLVEHSKDGMTPTEIAARIGNMPRNTLSFHLNLLSRTGLCTFEKKGKRVVYKPKCSTIKKVAAFLLKDCCEEERKC